MFKDLGKSLKAKLFLLFFLMNLSGILLVGVISYQSKKQALKEQLKVGGRLIIPVGDERQQMTIITRTEKGYREETVLPVRFVPMTGEAQQSR